jgi:hypothetical protein
MSSAVSGAGLLKAIKGDIAVAAATEVITAACFIKLRRDSCRNSSGDLFIIELFLSIKLWSETPEFTVHSTNGLKLSLKMTARVPGHGTLKKSTEMVF